LVNPRENAEFEEVKIEGKKVKLAVDVPELRKAFEANADTHETLVPVAGAMVPS